MSFPLIQIELRPFHQVSIGFLVQWTKTTWSILVGPVHKKAISAVWMDPHSPPRFSLFTHYFPRTLHSSSYYLRFLISNNPLSSSNCSWPLAVKTSPVFGSKAPLANAVETRDKYYVVSSQSSLVYERKEDSMGTEIVRLGIFHPIKPWLDQTDTATTQRKPVLQIDSIVMSLLVRFPGLVMRLTSQGLWWIQCSWSFGRNVGGVGNFCLSEPIRPTL